MSAFDAYVICTSPRSGSTLLCNLLAGTGVAGRPESYFHAPSIAAWCADLEVPYGAGEPAPLAALFQAAMAEGTSGGVFGLRLQMHSFGFFRQQLALLHPRPSGDVARIEAAFGRTLFLYLTREDKVDQAVSFVKAQQTGLWHKAPDGREIERLSPPAPPVYDRAALRACYDEMQGYEQGWRAWFAANAVEPLRITYAGIAADPLGVLRRVLGALGQDPAAAVGVVPGLAKLADPISRDWALRFRTEEKIGQASAVAP